MGFWGFITRFHVREMVEVVSESVKFIHFG